MDLSRFARSWRFQTLAKQLSGLVEQHFRTEWPRVVATLVRDFGDLDLAEDCAQEAFLEASIRWEANEQPPDRPGAWLTTTARRKALDRIRRSASYTRKLPELEARARRGPATSPTGLFDEQLALLLGCCHPALNLEAQIALTLRLVGGLNTEQIARAFLVDPATMSKRLTRAKRKVRAAGIPFGPLDRSLLEGRVSAVCRVVYLIFTEGHASNSDEEFVRGDLCDEALWLSSLLARLLPEDSETHGLQGLILFADSRRESRVDDEGLPILLEDQDRSKWNRHKIRDGMSCLARARQAGALGTFGLQALLASFHAVAPSFEETNWVRVLGVYDLLAKVDSSAVVALNRAVALSFVDGAEAGLDAIEPLTDDLDEYVYFHSAKAGLFARLDRLAEARRSYERALELKPGAAQEAFLAGKLQSIEQRSA